MKLEELVGKPITEAQFDEAAGKKDACYHKVKARYDVWPSAYASGALVTVSYTHLTLPTKA